MRLASTGGRRLTHAVMSAKAYIPECKQSVTRKDLAAIARDAMKALNMRPALRLILGELVGCWGEAMIGDRILVWPSNQYLVDRTGLSERAVRYGMRGLSELQVLIPKDSANGKRFPIKNSARLIIDAFGFDLTPLWARRAEFAAEVVRQKEVAQRLRTLFNEITVTRRAIEEVLADNSALSAEFNALILRIPRRSPNVDPQILTDLLADLSHLRDRVEQDYYAAYGGNSDRLIESTPPDPNTESARKGSPREAVREENPSTLSLSAVLEACPALAFYSGPIRSSDELVEAGRALRASIGAHPSAWLEAIDKIGVLRAAIAVVYTLQLHEDDANSQNPRIRNPGGYFRALVRAVADGRMNLDTEILALRRKLARKVGIEPTTG